MNGVIVWVCGDCSGREWGLHLLVKIVWIRFSITLKISYGCVNQLEYADLMKNGFVSSLPFRSPVAPKKEAKGTATFTAIRAGKRKRNIVVSFLSDELAGVRGECAIHMN